MYEGQSTCGTPRKELKNLRIRINFVVDNIEVLGENTIWQTTDRGRPMIDLITKKKRGDYASDSE